VQSRRWSAPSARTLVYEIVWDDEVIEKLWRKHHVESWEVEEVVFDDEFAEFRWARDPAYGERLLVRGETHSNRSLFVALDPIRQRGIYLCRIAFDK